jgi:hypothetical protein
MCWCEDHLSPNPADPDNAQTREVNRFMRELQFPNALSLRGRPFMEV